MKTFKKESPEDFLRLYVDIFSVLYIPEEHRLVTREKEFFIHCVIVNSKKVDLKSKAAVDELQSRMNFSSKDNVYTYRKKLKRKGWIVQTKDGITLPPAFTFKTKIPNKRNFKFGIEWI